MTSFFTTDSRIIITCNKRITPFLQMETEALGFKIVRTFQTGIELFGSMNECIKLNLNLRCASQVLYSIKSFPCNHPDEVYKQLSLLPWEAILQSDGYFYISKQCIVNTWVDYIACHGKITI